MKIKESGGSERILSSVFKIIKNKKWLAAALYSLMIFVLGIQLHKAGLIERVTKPLLNSSYGYKLIRNYLNSLTVTPERITINIKYEDFQKLAYKRQQALSLGLLVTEPGDYVPAEIIHNGKTVKADIRLKGDLPIHLTVGDKWSYRIKVRGNNTIFGMKRFSIHHPIARNYINEWVFHQALKREGILYLRYKFIKVALNGKDLGIYALEEHFDKRLLENNKMREGPIIRFNESLMWQQKAQFGFPFPESKSSEYGSYLSSDIDAFQTNRSQSEAAGYVQYRKAISLLESFRRGKLKASAVFDIDKLSTFFALSDLMGAGHGSAWNNARFYYNPVTSLLEPIGFDGYAGMPIISLSAIEGGIYLGKNEEKEMPSASYYGTIFNDKIFFKEYVKKLELFSNRQYLDDLFLDLKIPLKKNLAIIHRDLPGVIFDKNTYYRNQDYIKAMLTPKKGLHAYYRNSSDREIELCLGNIQDMPIEILDLSLNGNSSIIFRSNNNRLLPSKLSSRPVEFLAFKFKIPQNFYWSDKIVQDLRVSYKIYGADKLMHEAVFPWPYLDKGLIDDDFIRRHPNMYLFDFISADIVSKKIFFKPGDWSLTRNLIIPKGYEVFAGEGVRLNLMNSAKILTYSPLIFIGSEENPVILYSSDSTGQGLIVMNSPEESVFKYVHLDNLSSPSQDGWELTGSVNFYESDIDISNCAFSNNRSEDALNIIRAKFKIENTLFQNASSDAFDGDFSIGTIVNSSFIGSGNDGIDISGSEIDIQDIFISNAGDKGVSVGESSNLTGKNIKIINSEVGIASKDLSKVDLSNVEINNSSVGFAAYRKKPEFGEASINVNGLAIHDTRSPYLIEAGSEMFLNGKKIIPRYQNVEQILLSSQKEVVK